MRLRIFALVACLGAAYVLAAAADDASDGPVAAMVLLVALGGLIAGRWWAPLVALGIVVALGGAVGVAVAIEGDESEMPAFAAFAILSLYGVLVAAIVAVGVLVRRIFDAWLRWAQRPVSEPGRGAR
jgi:hypothetical protein